MTDRRSRSDTGVGHDRESSGRSRWTTVVLIVVAVLALVVVVMLVVGGPGGHGPGRHTPSGGSQAHRDGAAPVARRWSPCNVVATRIYLREEPGSGARDTDQ